VEQIRSRLPCSTLHPPCNILLEAGSKCGQQTYFWNLSSNFLNMFWSAPYGLHKREIKFFSNWDVCQTLGKIKAVSTVNTPGTVSDTYPLWSRISRWTRWRLPFSLISRLKWKNGLLNLGLSSKTVSWHVNTKMTVFFCLHHILKIYKRFLVEDAQGSFEYLNSYSLLEFNGHPPPKPKVLIFHA
jgi:hypothetical protein